jgi:Pectate lyase superfamily protein
VAVDQFANRAVTNITSGGTTAPSGGTVETWTAVSWAGFPAAVTGSTQFRIVDENQPTEIILVTNLSGATATVTRGAENTTPVAHSASGFTVYATFTAAAMAQLQVTDWLNVATMFGADPADTADSTAGINAAFSAAPSGGGYFYFPRGAFKASGALNVPTGAVIQGAGEDVCIISQTSTTADTLAATDQRYITVRDIQLTGPGSGTGRGIAFLHSAAAVAGINLENVIVQDFGGDGIHLETVITSALTKVRSQSNGGHGVFANNGTSLSLKACYANANTGNGYELDAMNYMQLDSCAADNDTIGYSVNGSSAVVLNACGSESCTDGYKILGASANIVLQGCKVIGETGIGFWVTGNSTFCFVLGCREASPGGGATASFQVDSGSAAVVVDPQNTTANNYAAGTVCLFQPTNLEIHSSGNTVARISRGATTNTANYVVQTGNSNRWAWGFNPSGDSTDDMYLNDIGHSTTLLHAPYQATAPNLGLFGKPAGYLGGVGVVFLANAGTAPSGTPSGGGILYASGGHLYWLGATGSAVELA